MSRNIRYALVVLGCSLVEFSGSLLPKPIEGQAKPVLTCLPRCDVKNTTLRFVLLVFGGFGAGTLFVIGHDFLLRLSM